MTWRTASQVTSQMFSSEEDNTFSFDCTLFFLHTMTVLTHTASRTDLLQGQELLVLSVLQGLALALQRLPLFFQP